jgi:hypothetical protein
VFYYIEPEVSGGLGENTIADTSVHPPLVKQLHYQFDGWLGDDLLESFPCYIITERLMMEIEKANLSGYKIDNVEVSKSDQFKEIYPDKELPNFYWLRADGVAGSDDFGIASDGRLVVSEKAMSILKTFKIDQADVESY